MTAVISTILTVPHRYKKREGLKAFQEDLITCSVLCTKTTFTLTSNLLIRCELISDVVKTSHDQKILKDSTVDLLVTELSSPSPLFYIDNSTYFN